MTSSRRKSITTNTRTLIDLAARIVLGSWFGFSACAYFINGFGKLQKIDPHLPYYTQVVDGVSLLAIGLYCLMVTYLYVIRTRPINKFAGIVPAVTAILGGFLILGLIALHMRTDLPVGIKIIALTLVLCGNMLMVVILNYLGRSFSILPEGRRLVTSGPYRIVRHPLYVAEAISTIGAMISYWSPAAIALVVTQLLLQLGRIHYEEQVLRKTFPQYAGYCRRTKARLIPGIY